MTAPTDFSYTAQALRTESPITPALQTRLRENPRLVHAVLGLLTEAGELADPVKKHIYYGRPLDTVNLREEIGDCLWYLAIAADALGTTLEAEQTRNLAKLRTRYPHVFTAEAAQVRDLDRERQVLEGAEVEALRQQLDAAQVTILAQRAGIELQQRVIDVLEGKVDLLQRFAEKIRMAHHCDNWPSIGAALDILDGVEFEHLSRALAQLNAGTSEPAPATEPAFCEECQRWQRTQRINSELFASKAKEIERLQAFVGKVRSVMDRQYDGVEFDDLSRALDELDRETEPAPATEANEDDLLDRIDGDALAAGITEMVREIVEGRKAKAAGNSSATLNSSVVKQSLTTELEGGQWASISEECLPPTEQDGGSESEGGQ